MHIVLKILVYVYHCMQTTVVTQICKMLYVHNHNKHIGHLYVQDTLAYGMYRTPVCAGHLSLWYV